jgi:hypothetical protein
VALFAVLLLAGAYVAPTATAAGLRATKCCAEHCSKPRSPAAASHCCPTLGAAADVATLLPSAKASHVPPLAAVALLIPPALVLSMRCSPSIETAASPRAAPLYLRALSLRL